MIVHASRADDLFVGLRKRGAASSLRLRARATREVESAKLSAFRLLCRRSQQRYPRAAIWGTFWRILRQVSTDRRGQSHPVDAMHRPRVFAYIEEVVVSSHHRRLGVGKALMQRVEGWARDRKVDQIELIVWEFNDEARKFYESLGYTTSYRRMFRT